MSITTEWALRSIKDLLGSCENYIPTDTEELIIKKEQLNKIAREIAGFPGEKAETLRKNMAKKKMKELSL